MRRKLMHSCYVLAVLLSLAACDAASVPVFSVAAAGVAGILGVAGTASEADSAGTAGAMSGGAGAIGGDTGSAGASAGRGGDIGAGGGDVVCHGNTNDCTDTFFCQTTTCEHGAPGVCVVRQPICEFDLTPVCGCDHVTYWNACLAAQNGMSVASKGPCSTGARTCRGNNECNLMFGATCARLLPQNLGCGTSTDQGTCWVTPDCTMAVDTREWQGCPPPGSGGALTPCMSTCDAMKFGHPSIQQTDTTACP